MRHTHKPGDRLGYDWLGNNDRPIARAAGMVYLVFLLQDWHGESVHFSIKFEIAATWTPFGA